MLCCVSLAQVALKFSSLEQLPAERTSLNLQAQPGSLCSVRAIDQSVLLLQEEQELTASYVRRPYTRHTALHSWSTFWTFSTYCSFKVSVLDLISFFNWPTWTFDSVGKSKKIDFSSIIGWCACIEPLLLVVSLLLIFTFLRQVYSKLPWRRLSGYSYEVDDDASYPCFPFMEDFLESHEPPSQKNDVYSIFKVFNVLICLPEFGYTSSFCTIYIVGGKTSARWCPVLFFSLCFLIGNWNETSNQLWCETADWLHV